jgi:predicted metalloprotease with PDZ domain
MRRLWQRHGAPPPPAPGLVARPYTLADLRRELGELVQDQAFADDFFDRYVEGREAMDYERLLAQAGFRLERVAPDRAWPGDVQIQEVPGGGLLVGGASHALVGFGTPAYEAGIDTGDVVLEIEGQPATRASWDALTRRRAGDRIALTVARRDGRRVATTLLLSADPTLRIVPAESRAPLPDAVRAFRDAWLGSRAR